MPESSRRDSHDQIKIKAAWLEGKQIATTQLVRLELIEIAKERADYASGRVFEVVEWTVGGSRQIIAEFQMAKKGGNRTTARVCTIDNTLLKSINQANAKEN